MMIDTIMRLIKQAIPVFKAWMNKKPSREVPEDFETRPKDKVYTSDEQIQIKKDFLTLNKYSRPGKLRKGVKAVEVHWVGNPGTSAKMNRNYFENRKGGKTGFGSTQFIVDQDGDLIQMIPEAEIAYSSGASKYMDGVKYKYGTPPYYNTLSIEFTHVDWTGKMNENTYENGTKLCAWLLYKYGLTAHDLELHFDLTGKRCHRWFVDNSAEWGKFRDIVDTRIKALYTLGVKINDE